MTRGICRSFGYRPGHHNEINITNDTHDLLLSIISVICKRKKLSRTKEIPIVF